ncbi:hypothetical protein LCGC14_0839970 [marine sediment metagenome]|uniref:Uncharacterized protein n=1 Tax=marine sediment metagenome TaxID=412755 RepID=A0A0F9PI39_9ZZZZ
MSLKVALTPEGRTSSAHEPTTSNVELEDMEEDILFVLETHTTPLDLEVLRSKVHQTAPNSDLSRTDFDPIFNQALGSLQAKRHIRTFTGPTSGQPSATTFEELEL